MVVVDVSVALAWVLTDVDENHLYSAHVAELGQNGTEVLIAPSVMLGEAAYVLLKRSRERKWGAARVAEMAEIIDFFQVRLVESAGPLASVIRFASRHNVAGFDAFYLALAISAGAKLATLDGGLASAARAAGVELLELDPLERP